MGWTASFVAVTKASFVAVTKASVGRAAWTLTYVGCRADSSSVGLTISQVPVLSQTITPSPFEPEVPCDCVVGAEAVGII